MPVKVFAKNFGVDRTTVSRIHQKYKTYGSHDHLGNNGKPKKLSEAVLAQIKLQNSNDCKKSLRKIQNSLKKDFHIDLNYNSVRNGLHELGKFAFSSIKKPLLSKKNILTRYEFSKYLIKTDIAQLESTIFSDECKFNLFYSDGKASVWREPKTGLQSKHLVPTVKHGGGSVMVWGCFSSKGVGKLHFIDGIMRAVDYVSIIADNLKASAVLMGLNEYYFQQDNDPKHTSKLAKEYFVENNIKLMPWPAQSPDMNPIENLWGLVKTRVAELQPKNISELRSAIVNSWNEITPELACKLVRSVKKRAIALYDAKGNHINY